MKHPLLLAGLVLGLTATVCTAQTPPAGCVASEYRQFDFWIGEWNVTAAGNQAGTNRITPILDGCVIQEEWEGAAGLNGKSYNIYNRANDQWQQFWVDSRGSVLELAGHYADGKMILEGQSKGQDGSDTRQRITWFNHEDEGTVRQLWEMSSDGGQTWSVAFDGLYTPQLE